MPGLSMPGARVQEFWQFKRDFDRVAAQWIARGEETDASIAIARDGLRRYLAEADADESGRDARLTNVFAFWRDLAQRICPDGVAVRPTLRIESERRIADAEWAREERKC